MLEIGTALVDIELKTLNTMLSCVSVRVYLLIPYDNIEYFNLDMSMTSPNKNSGTFLCDSLKVLLTDTNLPTLLLLSTAFTESVTSATRPHFPPTLASSDRKRGLFALASTMQAILLHSGLLNRESELKQERPSWAKVFLAPN